MLLTLAVALAIGLLIGFERERSHPGTTESVGSRTLALLALAGAVAASAGVTAVAAGMLVVGGLLTVAYLQTSEHDPGLTTEAASLLAYLLGALAWTNAEAAAAVAVVATVLLASKRELHHFVRNVVVEVEVEDALKFFVAAFVVLPLLPNRNLGPYGVLNPHRIWVLVVSLTGIGWAGYVAVRMFGPRRGLPLAAFAAGFVSATVTTVTMARASRRPDRFWPALVGALLASLATLLQLAAVLGIAHPDVLVRLAPALAAGGVVILAEALLVARFAPHRTGGNTGRPGPQAEELMRASERPFALVPALVLAGMLTAVLLVARAGAAVLGTAGATLVAAVSGFADAHAPALAVVTLARQGSVPVAIAVAGCAAALATNTLTKCVLSFASGGRRFGVRFCLGLFPPVIAVGAVLLL